MYFNSIHIALLALLGMVGVAISDSYGYVLPQSGVASTDQFSIESLLSEGTACGVSALPNGKKINGTKGAGPGYLYASINQLAFGANPLVKGGGGPGAACGVCYSLTPRDSSGTLLTENSLIFQIVDECTAGIASGTGICSPCNTTQVNKYGRTWHFGIATDAMSEEQYTQFYHHSQGTYSWTDVEFEEATCGVDNPTPSTKSWGCLSKCSNNEKSVCAKDSSTTTAVSVVTVTVVATPTAKTTSKTKTTTTPAVATITLTLPSTTSKTTSTTSAPIAASTEYVTVIVTV